MRLHLRLFLGLAFCRKSVGWHSCSDGGKCPDGNMCCTATNEGNRMDPLGWSSSAGCISGSNDTAGSCCNDDGGGKTGCGGEYICAFDSESSLPYCKHANKQHKSYPDRLPRYKQCYLPSAALENVYGIPVSPRPDFPQPAYYSTMGALDAVDSATLSRHLQIHTVIISVHGAARNADDYLCCTNAALPTHEQNPSTSSVMVISPWFLTASDGTVNLTSPSAAAQGSAVPMLWPENVPIENTYRAGSDAVNANFSSYAVIDEILERLVGDPVRFPSLKRVVVAGHSAGGQLTQRWALLSSSPAFESSRVSLRVIVANPRSLCFLDGRRYFQGEFRLPNQSERSNCTDYNSWEWGLGEGDTKPTPYKERAVAVAGGIEKIVQRYSSRDVVYLAGEFDVVPIGDCVDNFQGAYRRERSRNFMMSLLDIYGRPVHHRLIVLGVHHDHCLMYQSSEGHLAFFGTLEDTEVSTN